MKKRLSSFDPEYTSGSLSVFPNAQDSFHTLYEASNNAKTKLKHTLSPVSKFITVENADKFPYSGILKIESFINKGEFEIIHYSAKVANQFHYLQRGFAGYNTYTWPIGSNVSLPVMAEHHNVLKDAIINIEKKIGLQNNPSKDSLNGNLKSLEEKWLNPKANFRCYPKEGNTPLNVKFQNTSIGNIDKFLWDFGDGNTSSEKNPNHIYQHEGTYNVKLNVIAKNGSQGLSEKFEYINVINNKIVPFFYYEIIGDKEVEFVDQTSGDITERHWIFEDNQEKTTNDFAEHTIKHQYLENKNYKCVLILRFSNNKTIRSEINVNLK